MATTEEKTVTTSTTTNPNLAETRPVAAATERTEELVVDPYAERRNSYYIISNLIWLILGIVDGLIAVRFILRLLGANPAAGFARFIYGLSTPLIAPFVGLFPSPRFEGSVLEVTSLVALVVYFLAASLLVSLFSILLHESRVGSMTRRTETRIQ